MKQGVGEPVDNYLTHLRGQAKFGRFACGSCKVSFEDEIILDVVVKNTLSPWVRQTAFKRGSTKLTDVLPLARALETSISYTKEMGLSGTVMTSEYKEPKGLHCSKGTWSTQKANPKMDRGNCKFSGEVMSSRSQNTPAFGKECSQCRRMDHFRLNDGVGEIPYAFLRIKGKRIKLLLDFGSNVNILPKHLVDMSKVIKNTGPIEVFGGGKVKTLGSISLLVALNGSDLMLRKFIVSPIGQPILGFWDCLDFRLVKLSNSTNACTAGASMESRVEILQKKHNFIFDDSKGSTTKYTQAGIHLQDNARPRYIRARSVPLALREKVAAKIREMEKRGTIS
ncbi:uncharacterized protein [Lepeophtheirus salmonis]|uniref:uncharacterized protein n=1 Tax=Lepeophtheirus salmonis TaxID=72036 RepID=UPI001AEA21EE|nr:uncharacterized protein LOC121114942 [Lepeophtheirus salmonis]